MSRAKTGKGDFNAHARNRMWSHQTPSKTSNLHVRSSPSQQARYEKTFQVKTCKERVMREEQPRDADILNLLRQEVLDVADFPVFSESEGESSFEEYIRVPFIPPEYDARTDSSIKMAASPYNHRENSRFAQLHYFFCGSGSNSDDSTSEEDYSIKNPSFEYSGFPK